MKSGIGVLEGSGSQKSLLNYWLLLIKNGKWQLPRPLFELWVGRRRVGGPKETRVSPSPLDFGTSDSGLTKMLNLADTERLVLSHVS